MWKLLWSILSSSAGQVPDGQSETAPADDSAPVEINERAADDENWGVRTPYDSATPDPADSSNPESTPAPTQSAPAATAPAGEEPYLGELNLDPTTFSPEMQEVFKRMQAAHTKKMQRFKGFEGHLQNMDRFYNDRAFAEQALRTWAQKNGFAVVPSQFNNQPAASQPAQGVNALQHKLVETLKSKLPQETQWMADGQGAAIFEVMKEVLGPVLQEFQGFKTAKEENDWNALESEYEATEQEFANKYPGWETHEDEMSKVLTFLNDQKAYRHPQYGSKHELLYKLVTGQATAIKQATERVTQAGKNKTPTSSPGKKGTGLGFANVQDEVAAVPDRKDAFALAANKAMQQLRRRK